MGKGDDIPVAEVVNPEKENDVIRARIAVYGAVLLIVVGLVYFLLKRFVFDNDDEDDDDDFIIRQCNVVETVSDVPCGLNVKTPQGKYCCINRRTN